MPGFGLEDGILSGIEGYLGSCWEDDELEIGGEMFNGFHDAVEKLYVDRDFSSWIEDHDIR